MSRFSMRFSFLILVARILVGPAVGEFDGILQGGERDLLAERGGEVDAADVGEPQEHPEAIGQLVRQIAEGRRVGQRRGDLVVGLVAEVFEHLAHLAGKRQAQVFGVVELFPVALAGERLDQVFQRADGRLGVGHRSALGPGTWTEEAALLKYGPSSARPMPKAPDLSIADRRRSDPETLPPVNTAGPVPPRGLALRGRSRGTASRRRIEGFGKRRGAWHGTPTARPPRGGAGQTFRGGVAVAVSTEPGLTVRFAPDPAGRDSAPASLGRYRLVERLGRGRQADVWRADRGPAGRPARSR